MHRTRSFVLLVLFFLSKKSFPQEYSYTHYDIREGLAGATVYCITQDSQGFLWMGTEAGISRFDGTHFRNFTISDGLPDIEVFQMFTDSRGRIWMATGRRSVCYYYQGEIHSQINDPTLRKIIIRQSIENFSEDSAGDILMQEKSGEHMVMQNGTVRQNDSLCKITARAHIPADKSMNNVQAKYLPGIEVSRIFKDADGNLWFTTLGQGIFRLNSEIIKNISIQVAGAGKCNVHSITRIGDFLFVGTNHDFVFRYPYGNLVSGPDKRRINNEKNRILFINEMTPGNIMISSDYGIVRYNRELESHISVPVGIKAVFRKNQKELLFAASWGAGIFDTEHFCLKDTLWRERATAIYYRYDTIYIGALNGLYQLTKDKNSIYLGEKIPFFRRRISAIAGSEDSTLWIASYDDAGLVGYRNGKIIATITKKQGLTSDICRNLLIHNNILWVGTDKGLNRIDLGKPGYPVTRYSAKDGLGSDIINTIYADGHMIYAGTPAGLTYFDETKVIASDTCRLLLLAVINSGKDRTKDTANFLMPYDNRNIRFEFAAISYRSNGSIIYRYRLLGLDTLWKQTNETFLEYPVLPSGKYELQIRAVNRFGVNSNFLSQHFLVATPYWKTAWFNLLILAAFLALTWLFVLLRIKNIRRRQETNDQLARQLVEMEQMALRAQMNPHFIFNCLNSIQQYIFDQDVLAANKYLTGFAKLIRSTLHNSSQAYITLDRETDYLSNYLSLEKIRLKDKIEYSIYLDPALDEKNSWIPPMIIQPYIENSIRHGLRHKTDGKGYLQVKMLAAGDKLKILVEDNGVGRKSADRHKTGESVEYQSRGMSLTADRIRLINSVHGGNITVEVTDLGDDQGHASGTRVVILLPRFDTPAHGADPSFRP